MYNAKPYKVHSFQLLIYHIHMHEILEFVDLALLPIWQSNYVVACMIVCLGFVISFRVDATCHNPLNWTACTSVSQLWQWKRLIRKKTLVWLFALFAWGCVVIVTVLDSCVPFRIQRKWIICEFAWFYSFVERV